MSTRILLVAGTRPEIIKLAPIIREARTSGSAEIYLCSTGQHRSMAEEAFRMFDLAPDTDLRLMQHDQSLSHIGSAVLSSVPPLLDRVGPDIMMVQGDTSTAAFSALAGFHCGVPVAHVEAGLRSGRLDAPYPEEANRRMISLVASYHFCPTRRAADTLIGEGIGPEIVHMTGNTVVDALQLISSSHSLDDLEGLVPALQDPFVLVTAHRRESFGEPFRAICSAIREAAQSMPGLHFVYPVHLNPHIAEPARTFLGGLPNVHLIDPVPYLSLMTLLKHSAFVLTDSGGIQEEAPSFGKFCIVLREVTERVESIEAGISELVGTDEDRILGAIRREHETPTPVPANDNPYGDGHASERIVNILKDR